MEQHTYRNRCGGIHDPDLVQDVDDLVQSVKDDIVMQKLGSMEIVRDVHQGGSVPRVGLQQLRKALEDVDMKDVDTESEVDSERDNLARAQHEAEGKRNKESETATMTPPHQSHLRASGETKSGSQRSRRLRAITREEYDTKQGPVEQAEQLRLLPDSAAMEETTFNRDSIQGGHSVIQSQPKIRPLAQKIQWIAEDSIMEDFED